MSGSTASLVPSVAPDIVRSVQGDTSHAHAGCSSPAARSVLISATVRPPPALSPPIGDVRRRNASPCAESAMPSIASSSAAGNGCSGREPISDRQRAHPGRSSRLGQHAAVTANGARAIAAAVEEHQHAARRRFLERSTTRRARLRDRLRRVRHRRRPAKSSRPRRDASRRSAHPTGRGFEVSNSARMASISLVSHRPFTFRSSHVRALLRRT